MMKPNLLKEKLMEAFRKSLLAALALTAVLAACAPAQPSQEQIQSQVQTSVALTVQGQNQIGTFVAETVEAQQPAGTATIAATTQATSAPLPTFTPVVIPSFTPVSSGGGGGGGGSVAQLAYSCGQEDWRPLDGTVFAPGDHFIVKWTLLNNGTQQWCEGNSCSGGPDLTFAGGTNFLAASLGTGPIQANSLKPGQTEAFGPYGGIAPNKPGTYTMNWKLEDMQNSECVQFLIVVK
jgi:hypothetical protein